MKLLPYSLQARASDTGAGNGGGPPPEPKEGAVKFVTVKVLCAALSEGGLTYYRGESLSVAEDRAKALGELVAAV